MKTSAKLILLFISSIFIFSSCKKLDENSYPKDSIVLSLTAVNGAELLSWTKVNASDFKRYEIYASNKDNIDIIKSTDKLIGTVTDLEKTTFTPIDALSDSSTILSSKTYFKVAAVLQDRKLSSNVISKNSDIIFSSKNVFFQKVIPEKGYVYFSDNSFGNQILINIPNNSRTDFSTSVSVTNNSKYAIDNNNQCDIISATGSNTFDLYKAEDLSLHHQVNSSEYFYNFSINKGFLFAAYYNSSISNYEIGSYTLVGNILSKVSTTSIGSNSSSSTFYISSDGTKLYVADFNYVTSYNIAANGQLTKIGQQFSSSFNNFMFMNNNGTKIISNSGDVYNEQFQMQKSIGFSNTGMYNFSEDGSKIVFGGNNNKIELYDGNSLNKIKSINVEVKNQTVNGLTPFFYNNELYCIVQAFDNNTFQQSVLIIKKTI
jgi:hypothetical protein